MNTTFKILWFEDEPTWYNMEKLRVEGILKTHYLIPSIIRKSGDDFNIDELTGNGNVKKCAVGKHPKSEKLGSTGQAACCARIHSRYFTGGNPSGLRV